MAIIKINGEQPFKVVGRDFTVGASENGYILAFCHRIDGTYTSYPIPCPAGEENAVVGAPMAIYWKLLGNNGEVEINC